MKHLSKSLKTLLSHWRWVLAVTCLIIMAALSWRIYSRLERGVKLFETTHSETIETTPEEIRAIRDIGEWEFLSVSTEELIERHEAHTFGDRHLVRIYRGTLRIGIDMKRADADWFVADSTDSQTQHRTAILTLPPIALLDSNFIDEARTTTFYEKGTFSARAKEEMLLQAAQKMKRRTLTSQNINMAQRGAEEQFTKLFKSLGYKNVIIRYKDDKTHKKSQNQNI